MGPKGGVVTGCQTHSLKEESPSRSAGDKRKEGKRTDNGTG